MLISTLFFAGCYRNSMLNYYSDDANYVVKKGIIEKLIYEGGRTAYFHILWYNEVQEQREIETFKIPKKSYDILYSNGFYSSVEVGDEITFTTALCVFGDGYIIPIVEIWHSGFCYLDFENGKSNLLDFVKETEKFLILAKE